MGLIGGKLAKDNGMMRTITDHKIGAANTELEVYTIDDPGPGGAHHCYGIESDHPRFDSIAVMFQKGPIAEAGVNGVTHEVLLAIIIDRLRSFQAGLYSCKANAMALTHIEEALHWLQQRTLERMRRGVEGTSTV